MIRDENDRSPPSLTAESEPRALDGEVGADEADHPEPPAIVVTIVFSKTMVRR